MNLKEFKENLLSELSCNDINELEDYILRSIADEEMLKHLMETLKLHKIDAEENPLQRFYQFYFARREEFSQDFTSLSIAKLLANFIKTDGDILDICSGFGQLSVQHNNNSPYDNHYFAEELDDKIIPWLLVNLAFHNVNAGVKHVNALTRDEKANYIVEKGEKYGSIRRVENINYLPEDIRGVLSNPPFDGFDNYSFVLQGLYSSSNDAKLSFILPKKVLTNSSETFHRKNLVDNSYLKAVILCPRAMFESTNIPVTILYLDKTNDTNKVSFIDASNFYDYAYGIDLQDDEEIKNEILDKKLIIFNDNQIERICECIEKQIDDEGFSKTVDNNEIKAKDYNLNPKLYV